MPDTDGLVAERPALERRQEPDPPRRETAPEPATPRALWPTFMRRTLCEETLQAGAERAGR